MAPRPSGHPLWVMPRRGGCFDNAVVADDLTGATTVGALLARIGVQPTVILDHHQLAEVANPDDEVIIVSTDSRPMPPEVAFGRVHTASGVLRDLGAQHFSKRIDTTCRGCIGAETEGMMTAVGDDAVAVIVPAMPQSNRVVAGGYSLINSVLLSRTDVARDIRTPVTESHLPTLFRSQFSVPVAHVDLTDVVGGADQVAARLTELRAAGNAAFLVDAVSLDDIDTIAQAVVGLGWEVVTVDPGPFTVAVAVASGVIERRPTRERTLRSEPSADDLGTVLVVAGSASGVTHDQISLLLQQEGSLELAADVLALTNQDAAIVQAEMVRVVEAARAGAAAGARVAVLTLDSVVSGVKTDAHALEDASGRPAADVSNLLKVRLGTLARRVADAIGVGRLAGMYLTGGDIMVASCQALGAQGLKLVDYVQPQIDQATIVGGPFDGVPVVCKGGLTGTADIAVLSVNRLFDERYLSHV